MQLFNRPGRRTLAVVAAALACSAAVALPAVAQASQASQKVPRCRAANTYVWVALAPSGAAGTIYYPIEFTNLGSRACWLYGIPSVRGTTSSGTAFGPRAGRLTISARPILLRSGHTAHALLGIVEPGIIAGCHAVAGAGLLVRPPGQRHEQVIGGFYFSGCSNRVYMRVQPVQAGIGVP